MNELQYDMATKRKRFINQNTQVFNNINITYGIWWNTEGMIRFIIANLENSTFL